MRPLALLVAVLLIAVNALFAMAEYALVRIRASRVEELLRQGRRFARRVRFATEHLGGFLSAVQLVITMTSLGLGWVGEPAVAAGLRRLLGRLPDGLGPASSALTLTLSFTLAFLLVTAAHITFGELLPKLLAIRFPERALRFTILPLTAMYWLSYLPMALLNGTAAAVARLLTGGREAVDPAPSDEEIKILLGEKEEEGALSLSRLLMFENLFDFGRATAREVMTPRGSIAWLSLERPWEENLAVMLQRKATRYPVCSNDLDNVLGYLHLKDLAFGLLLGGEEPDLMKLARPILRLGEGELLEECLRRFQAGRHGLAIVEDEHGNVAGLLTMEDVVEEIIGEIRDEHEKVPAMKLSELTVLEASRFDCRCPDLPSLLRDCLLRLHAARPVFDFQTALERLVLREKGMSSALGHEAAFPHARLDRLERPLISFSRYPEGAPFNAPDGRPVRLVFTILTPFNEPTAQLRILSSLARLVVNPTLRQRLLDATTPEELWEVLAAFEGTVPL